MFHLLFWIFTSLLVFLVFQLMSVTSSVLGGGGPSIKDNLGFLLITLQIGVCLFYASYFSLNFFVKRPTRFIWIAVGYIIFTLVFLIPAIVADLKSARNPDFLASIMVFYPVYILMSLAFYLKLSLNG